MKGSLIMVSSYQPFVYEGESYLFPVFPRIGASYAYLNYLLELKWTVEAMATVLPGEAEKLRKECSAFYLYHAASFGTNPAERLIAYQT